MKCTTAVTPLIVSLILNILSRTSARAADDGKYTKRRYHHGNHGKYVHRNGGDYEDDTDRYRYVHYDDGDRGRYFHVHVPYDGGYGNYEGGHEPFRNPPYDASGLYAYVQKPKDEACLRLLEQYSKTCSDSSSDNPFKANEFDVKKPSIYLEYGTPYPAELFEASSRQEKHTSAAANFDPRISNFPGTSYLPVPKPPAAEYGPPELRKVNASTKQISVIPVKGRDIASISFTTARAEESKINFVTSAPEKHTATSETQTTVTSTSPTTVTTTTTQTSPSTSTVSSTTTTETTPSTTTEPPSIQQQLDQCRSELESALLKLSHKQQAKCD